MEYPRGLRPLLNKYKLMAFLANEGWILIRRKCYIDLFIKDEPYSSVEVLFHPSSTRIIIRLWGRTIHDEPGDIAQEVKRAFSNKPCYGVSIENQPTGIGHLVEKDHPSQRYFSQACTFWSEVTYEENQNFIPAICNSCKIILPKGVSAKCDNEIESASGVRENFAHYSASGGKKKDIIESRENPHFSLSAQGKALQDEAKNAVANLNLTCVMVGTFLVIMKSDFDIIMSGEPYIALMLMLNLESGKYISRMWNQTIAAGSASQREELTEVCKNTFYHGRPCLGLPVGKDPFPRKMVSTCKKVLGNSVSNGETTCEECNKLRPIPGLQDGVVKEEFNTQEIMAEPNTQKNKSSHSFENSISSDSPKADTNTINKLGKSTYRELITEAINNSDMKMLPLSGIYEYIAMKYPDFKMENRSWQNSIRHNLSLHRSFMKVPGSEGRVTGGRTGSLWAIIGGSHNVKDANVVAIKSEMDKLEWLSESTDSSKIASNSMVEDDFQGGLTKGHVMEEYMAEECINNLEKSFEEDGEQDQKLPSNSNDLIDSVVEYQEEIIPGGEAQGEPLIKSYKIFTNREKCKIIDQYYEFQEKNGKASSQDLGKIFGVPERSLRMWITNKDVIRAQAAEETCGNSGGFASSSWSMITMKRKWKEEQIVKCPLCDRAFLTSQGFQCFIKHMKFRHFYGNFKCIACGFRALFAKDMTLHMAKCCQKIDPFVLCPFVKCGKKVPFQDIQHHYEECTKTIEKARRDKHSWGNTGPQVCPECGKTLSSKSTLKSHMETHKVDQGLIAKVCCDKCGKEFKNKVCLKIHIQNLHNEDPIPCKVCGQMFATHWLMLVHRRKEHRPLLQCEHCEYSTHDTKYLKEHRRKHLDPVFKCSYCEKKLKTKLTLEAHEREHTGERPFECNICGKGFKSQGVLYTHRKDVHKMVTPGMKPIEKRVRKR